MKFADGMITRLVRVGDELQFEVAWDKPEDGDPTTTVLESEIRPRPITQARGSVFCLPFPIPRHPPTRAQPVDPSPPSAPSPHCMLRHHPPQANLATATAMLINQLGGALLARGLERKGEHKVRLRRLRTYFGSSYVRGQGDGEQYE